MVIMYIENGPVRHSIFQCLLVFLSEFSTKCFELLCFVTRQRKYFSSGGSRISQTGGGRVSNLLFRQIFQKLHENKENWAREERAQERAPLSKIHQCLTPSGNDNSSILVVAFHQTWCK